MAGAHRADDADPLERLRAICFALSEAHEQPFGGHSNPTWRVNGKIFVSFEPEGAGVAAWCKAPPGAQQVLVGANPERFFVPRYVGPKGWIGIRLDGGADWDEVAGMVAESYRLIAPRRLVAAMGGG